MYAHLAADGDQAKLDRVLDAPLLSEMSEQERLRDAIRRVADANRAAVAALGDTAAMRRP